MKRRFAVEAKPSQIKHLNWTHNAYIVEGEPNLFVWDDSETGETFEVTGGKAKNAFLRLCDPSKRNDKPFADGVNKARTVEPRPKGAAGWVLAGDVWLYS